MKKRIDTKLTEAKVQDEKARKVEVILITSGKGNPKDKNFYTPEAIMNASQVFEGKPCYANHPSTTEEVTRPERSITDIVGYYENVKPVMENGIAKLKATLKILSGSSKDWVWDLVKESLSFANAFPNQNLCGLSINAYGETEPMDIDGEKWKAVTRITDAKSVDIVTVPARGGRMLKLIESMGGQMTYADILNAIKSKTSELGESEIGKELIALCDEGLKMSETEIKPEEKTAEEKPAEDVKAEIKVEEKPIDEVKKVEAEKEEVKDDKQMESLRNELDALKKTIDGYQTEKLLRESKLPEGSVEFLKSFMDGKTENEKIALIESKKKEIASLSESIPAFNVEKMQIKSKVNSIDEIAKSFLKGN